MIYGDINIEESYQAASEVRALAAERVAVLVAAEDIEQAAQGVALKGKPWGELVGACPGEPFVDQISAGYCTATIVAPDLAVTAYHCLGWLDCTELAVVRRYQYEAGSSLTPIQIEQDVRYCDELVWEVRDPGLPPPKLGWIRLSEPFAELETSIATADVALEQSVSSLSHIGGIPLKLLQSARVYDHYVEDGLRTLVTNLDAFHGSSGSPVLDDERHLVGVLVSGAADFVGTEEGCSRFERGPDGVAAEVAVSYDDARRSVCLEREDAVCREPASDSGCNFGDRAPAGPLAAWTLLGMMLWGRRASGLGVDLP